MEQISIDASIDDLSRLPEVKSAVAASIGATISQVRYDIRDRASANAEAMLGALADARAQLDALAAKSNLHVGAQRSSSIQVNGQGQNSDRTAVRIDASASATYDVYVP